MLTRNPDDNVSSAGTDLRFNPVSRPPVGSAHSAPAAPVSTVKKSPFEGMECEGAVLIGAGAKVAGDISSSRTVEIQGFLEGNVVTNSLIVRAGGGFKGEMQTQNAEVHGTIEGTLAVQDLLDIRATGRVSAEATYGKLAVSAGGCLTGNVQVKSPVVLEDIRAKSDVEDSSYDASYNGSREGNSRA